MPISFETLSQKADWQKIREDFLQTKPTPTYLELAERHGVTYSLVARMGKEENWPELRIKQQEALLVQAKANDIILTAITGEQRLIKDARDTISHILAKTDEMVQSLPAMEVEMKLSEKERISNVLQTLSFTAANCIKHLKEIGLVGLVKGMDEEGKSANGRWDTKLAQQINVVVNGVVQQQPKASAPVDAVPVDAQPVEPVR